MNLSLIKIKEEFPEFNLRPHNEQDFWKAAKRLEIIVKETPLLIEGYYRYKNRRHYIIINSSLNRIDWLLTVFHELTHRILDVPYKRSKILLKRDLEQIRLKQETRAEDIAAMFVIPQKMLFELRNTPFEEIPTVLQKPLIRRQRVFENYGE